MHILYNSILKIKIGIVIFTAILLSGIFLSQKISLKPVLVHAASCVASTYTQCGTGGCTPNATHLYSVTRTCTSSGTANYSCKDLGAASKCSSPASSTKSCATIGHNVGDTYTQCGGTCNGVTANAQQLVHVSITSSCGYSCSAPAYVSGQCGYTAQSSTCSVAKTYTECTNSNSYCSNGGKLIGHTMLVTQYANCPATPYKCVDQN